MKKLKYAYEDQLREMCVGTKDANSSSFVIDEEFMENYRQWNPDGGDLSRINQKHGFELT